ncbi:PAS domain-containing protein [Pararoseomonas baculiformis]|nr:PAS domain-containing protein [Pararoseomonas baculiformis]
MRLALAAVVMAPLLLAAAFSLEAWRGAWRGVETDVARMSDAAEQYARRMLEGQILRIHRANDLLAGLSDEEIRAREAEFHEALRDVAGERESRSGENFYLFIYNRDGYALASSNVLPVAANRPMQDREFNQALRGPDAPPFHVSPVYHGRDTQRLFATVTARRARTGNGLPPDTYDGVVNASLYLDHVNPALAALATGPGDVITLVREDGALLARSSGFGDRAPEDLWLRPDSWMLAAMRRAGEQKLASGASNVDGVERATAFRRIGGGWPVYVIASRAHSAILAGWAREVAAPVAIALCCFLLLLLLARGIVQRQRALEAANLGLERRVAERTRALAESERLTRLAQGAAQAAPWSWEPETGVVHWSPEMFALLGLDPAEVAAGFDVFMDCVHPEDKLRLREALELALREGSMSAEFRVFRRRPGGGREERWLLCKGHFYPAGHGEPATLFGIDLDVTESRRSIERLEAAATAMQGFVYEWDLPGASVTRIAGAATLLGEDIPATPEAWTERVHPEDRERVEAELDGCMADPLRDRYSMEYRVRRADGGWAWAWDRGRVYRDPGTGEATRALGGAVDITGRRLAEERQTLLMREVDHRGKNALAVVKAALRLTPINDAASFRKAIEGRVDALAQAQSLLAETNWSGTSLRMVLEGTLAPFLGDTAPRAELEGPPVTLTATVTQPLGMALHELATNATKYGALSSPSGLLRVSWWLEAEELRLRWEERGGPRLPEAPARKGFGSRVVDMTIRGQLGGRMEWNWGEEGLVVGMAVPGRRSVLASGLPADGPQDGPRDLALG